MRRVKRRGMWAQCGHGGLARPKNWRDAARKPTNDKKQALPASQKPRVMRIIITMRYARRGPQFGGSASFYDAKRVERCFFSRRGGHRPEEEWAFYWQKKPPFSGPSGDPEKVMPKSPQRPTPSRSNETTAVCHFGPTQFKSTHPPQP